MTGETSRAQKKLERRQELVDTAAAIFRQKSFEGTTIQDIADAVGILKGSLYHYIASKDDLLWEITQEMHEAGLAHISACEQLGGSAISTLRRFIRGHVDLMVNKRDKIAVFLHDYRSLSPDRLSKAIGERETYLRFAVELIKRGQEEGEFDSSLDPQLSGLAVLGMMNWMYEWYRPNSTWDPDAIAEFFTHFALSALTGSGDWSSGLDVAKARNAPVEAQAHR